ncbi:MULTISPECIES: hypothetical protein [unclassified Kitasatospora]|uniref:hypothetical protein n=1 Tax=unclassified Kitasatospora TaxID=2633591 RepID=UPI0033FBAC82
MVLVPEEDGPAGAGPVVPVALARQRAVERLLVLDARGELASGHVRLVADAVGVSLRTVWRWLAAARAEERTGVRQRERFTVTPQLHARLVLWCGNAAAVHRELLAEARAMAEADDTDDVGEQDDEGAASPVAVPSLATLHRAIRRDLNRGQRAALTGGERARRGHDAGGGEPVAVDGVPAAERGLVLGAAGHRGLFAAARHHDLRTALHHLECGAVDGSPDAGADRRQSSGDDQCGRPPADPSAELRRDPRSHPRRLPPAPVRKPPAVSEL